MKLPKLSIFSEWSNKQSALITGASSGLGADYARAFAQIGFKVILVARRREKLNDIAEEINKTTNITAEIIVADLARESDRSKIVDRINQGKDIDILVNNAGFGIRGKFSENPIEKYQEMLLVHNTAPVEFVRAAITHMKAKRRGVIINMSSLASLMKVHTSGIYCGSKSFLNKFSVALQRELGTYGIKVQAVCPGMTTTEFHSVRDYVGWDRNRIPKKAWMTSEDVVASSLQALQKNKVIIIPGRRNKWIIWLWNRPLLGKALIKFLTRK